MKCLCESQVEVAMVKDPQVWRETEDWLKMVKMHSERFRTKLSIQVINEYVKDFPFSSNCEIFETFVWQGDGGSW